MTYGLSRDDSVKFLGDYVTRGIYKKDPFQELDASGVGDLMKIAIERGRKANKKLKIGICGEHGGDPASVKTCHRLGLDYVSCSPYRIPVARLAAAQAAIEAKQKKATFKDV
jgi:pyruvate,orthophosphate dikinase